MEGAQEVSCSEFGTAIIGHMSSRADDLAESGVREVA
jgi:hypothetical protein